MVINDFTMDEMVKAYDAKMASLRETRRHLPRQKKKRIAMAAALEAYKVEAKRW